MPTYAFILQIPAYHFNYFWLISFKQLIKQKCYVQLLKDNLISIYNNKVYYTLSSLCHVIMESGALRDKCDTLRYSRFLLSVGFLRPLILTGLLLL